MHTPPCCTGNQARLLPNYIHHMWTMPADGGLAASMYGPSTVTTTVKGGQRVRIDATTDYPFEETVRMAIALLPPRVGLVPGRSLAAAVASFSLHLRIPGWCKGAKFTVNGATVPTKPNTNGYQVIDREWKTVREQLQPFTN
jgi:DUF1680 family protein